MKAKGHGIVFTLLLMTVAFSARAQTVVKGIIKDAHTGKPLQYVSVYFKDSKGVSSGADGSYEVETGNMQLATLVFSYVGYEKKIQAIAPGKAQELNISLLPSGEMEAVVITKKNRVRYRNKDNPAVALIRKVIDHKANNRITAYNYVAYEEYDKMELSLTNKPEKLLRNKLFQKYRFIIENQDTGKVPGKALLPFYLDETLSKKYFRKSPEKSKTYILGKKQVNFGEFVDNNGITKYLNSMYQDIDVYENNLTLLSNQFLSPIADLAPTFYMYFIKDTVELEGVKLARLYFSPRNPNDLLFKGTLFVTLDSNYAVQKIDMDISKHANLNWTKFLKVSEDFEKGSDGRYHVNRSTMLAEFSLSKNSTGGVLGERTVSFKNYSINEPAPDSVYKGPPVVELPNATNIPDSAWQAGRQPPLSTVESKVYTNIDSLQNMRSFKRFMDIATLLLAGYKALGPYEVGPVNAFYSFNPVEGFRLRAGGRTTPKFSNNLYLENYIAYGFKDEKWKYFLSASYSFNHKSVYAYPLNYLQLSYQYDTKIPGQELQFVQEDNFLLSFKRGDNSKWLYNNIFKAEYVREFERGLSYTLGFKNWKQTPAGSIEYINEATSAFVPNITTTELLAELRWAPHEVFYQGKVYRVPVPNKYPIIRFRYIAGIKGLVNGQYNYQDLNLNVFKRVYLSQFGYADLSVEGGYIFGKVPFPLLTIHRANQTYAYQLNSYNLMNFMEFVSDHYAAGNIDYYFNGFLFNKVPLLKRLKLREVLSAKILYGGVRNENNPDYNPGVFKFPADKTSSLQTTYTLNGKPYIELSAGVSNIFKLVRVDFVKRLTYLENPGVSGWGIRARTKFDF